MWKPMGLPGGGSYGAGPEFFDLPVGGGGGGVVAAAAAPPEFRMNTSTSPRRFLVSSSTTSVWTVGVLDPQTLREASSLGWIASYHCLTLSLLSSVDIDCSVPISSRSRSWAAYCERAATDSTGPNRKP